MKDLYSVGKILRCREANYDATAAPWSLVSRTIRPADVSTFRNPECFREVSERFSPGLGVTAKSLLAEALILVPTSLEYSRLEQS